MSVYRKCIRVSRKCVRVNRRCIRGNRKCFRGNRKCLRVNRKFVRVSRKPDLEHQEVEQYVEGGGGALPVGYYEGQVAHLVLVGVDEPHSAAVDQLVVLHFT